MRGSSIRRQRMVAELEAKGIRDRRVLEAMARVPREPFVEEALRAKAYTDAPLPIGEGQTISQPWIVARTCELLEPDGEGAVLEIGTGSGYHAAVLASLFERVFTVERIPALSRRAKDTVRALGIENVHFKIFDGSYGWSEFAPYRSILLTAAAPEVPGPLLEQIEPRGHLVLPLCAEDVREEQILVRMVSKEGHWIREDHGACRFVPLRGRFGFST